MSCSANALIISLSRSGASSSRCLRNHATGSMVLGTATASLLSGSLVGSRRLMRWSSRVGDLRPAGPSPRTPRQGTQLAGLGRLIGLAARPPSLAGVPAHLGRLPRGLVLDGGQARRAPAGIWPAERGTAPVA